MNIEQIKADLLLKDSLREKTAEEKKRTEKMAKGLDGIPVKKMMDQALHIKNDLLPRIKKKSGETSADYLFFESVLNNLIYSIILADRYESLLSKNVHLRVHVQLQREQLELYERELSKFTTLEEIFFTDGMDKYIDSVKNRAESILKHKK